MSKGFLIGVIFVSILITSFTAYATGFTKNIKAVFNAVNIKIDGKEVDGDKISYNGKVFTEAKSIAKTLDKDYKVDKSGNVEIQNKKLPTPTPTKKPTPSKNPIATGTPTPTANTSIVFDDTNFNLHGINYNSSYSEVIAKLGKPISEKNGQWSKTIKYTGITIIIRNDVDKAQYIYICDEKIKLKSGLKIGDSVDKWIEKFGEDYDNFSIILPDEYYLYGRFFFTVINDKVVAYGFTGSF